MCLDVFACLVWALGILWNFMKALSVVKRAMVETNSTNLAEEQLSEVYHRFVSEIKTSREGRIAFWKQCCFIQYMNPPNREPHPCVHISNYLKVVNSKSFLWGYFALASFFQKNLHPVVQNQVATMLCEYSAMVVGPNSSSIGSNVTWGFQCENTHSSPLRLQSTSMTLCI